MELSCPWQAVLQLAPCCVNGAQLVVYDSADSVIFTARIGTPKPMDLQAIFTREGILKKTIHSVWGCPGHIFIALDGGTLIRAYQMKSSIFVKQFTILAKISPVVKICFTQDTHDVILVFHKNGLVKVYEHFQPDSPTIQPWRKRGQFNLECYTRNSSVKTALCCSAQGRMVVWVEEKKDEMNPGTVRQSVFTAELEPYCKGIKTPIEILSGCLIELNLQANYDGEFIAVLPSQPSPAGLYIRLHFRSSDRSPELATSILGQGCVQRDISFPCDFQDLADDLIHIWSEVAKESHGNVVAMAMEKRTGYLYLISDDGTVHSVSQNGEEKVAAFQLDIDIPSVTEWFAHRFLLGAVSQKEAVIRVYSSTSGDRLQEMDLSHVTSSDTIKTWSILGPVPQIGFWSSEGIWLLQMQDASIATKTDTSNTVQHLQDFELNKIAASLELQKAYSELSDEGAVACDPDLDLLQDPSIFQNEALLVSLSQDVDKCKHPLLMEKVANLQKRFEEKADPTTDTILNESMLPLLKDFWRTQEERDKVSRGEMKGLGGLTLSGEVREALDTSSAIPIGLRLGKLELLSHLYPGKLLVCLLTELDLETAMKTGLDADEEAKPIEVVKHWSLCSPETEEGGRFLKMLARLLFMHQPSKLVEVVNFFQQLYETASELSAFTRKKHGLSVSGMVLDVLPDPSQSTNPVEAVKGQAQLIQNSDKNHGNMRAIRLLLSHSLWSEAMQVVEDHMPKDSQSHRELFYVLLCAMLQDSSVLHEYSQRLWGCLPPSISALNVLQTLQTNQDSLKNQLGMQVPGLTTALLKEQLLQMLAHESV